MTEHHDTHHVPHNPDELHHALVEHDDWFRHASDEPTHQSSHGDFNPYVVMTFLAVTIVLVFGSAAAIVPWFARMVDETEHLVQEDNPDYNKIYREKADLWRAELYGEATWADEKNNLVRIPINDAMDLVVKEYAAAK